MEQKRPNQPEADFVEEHYSPTDALDIRERLGGLSEREMDGRSLDENGRIIPPDPEKTKRYFEGDFTRNE